MTPEKQEVLWEKLVELKETPGKAGETPEKRGEPQLGTEPCLRLVDWERGKPYTFRLKDFDEMISSPCLFVRKLSLQSYEDRMLIQLLDEKIRS